MTKDASKTVRLNATETLVLGMLSRHGELYGLELVRQSEGRIKRGTVYVTLDRMQEKGLISSRQEDRAADVSGIPRRLYRPTGLGEKSFREGERVRASIFGVPVPSF